MSITGGGVPRSPESDRGLRAWLAQLDRSLGIRTYLLGAIAVLGLAASAVALVLQLKQDSVSKDDVAALQNQLSTIQDEASPAAERKVQSLQDQLTEPETDVDGVSGEVSSLKRQLSALQDEIAAGGFGLDGSGTGASGGGSSGGGAGSSGGGTGSGATSATG